ncbi:Lipoprotein lipase, partial [Folsomia candida]
MNIIYLDWSVLSTPTTSSRILSSYPVIVFYFIPLVSWKLAIFLQLLKNMGYVTSGKIHLIGYSLGSHVAGLTGQIFQSWNNGSKIGRITGLDPALPLFRNMFSHEWFTWRLGRGDADFVDVYHTAMRMKGLGQKKSGDGHADFYVNRGTSPQPGCLLMDLRIPVICSHLFAVQFFVQSIKRDFLACKCNSVVDLPMIGVVCLGGCRSMQLAGEGCSE